MSLAHDGCSISLFQEKKETGEGGKEGKRKREERGEALVPEVAADLSAEILQARKEWHDAFKVTKGKNVQPRIPSKTHSDLMEKSKALQTSNR